MTSASALELPAVVSAGAAAPPARWAIPGDLQGRCLALSVRDPAALAAAYCDVLAAGAVPLVLNPQQPEATARMLARTAGAALWLHEGGGQPRIEPLEGTLTLPGAGHVLCTSGTTGHGAVPSLYFFGLERARGNAAAHLASLGLLERGGARLLLPMPLSHSFGLIAGLYATALLGGTLFACATTPDPSSLLSLLERERIEVLYLTPPLLRLLVKRARGRSLGALPHLAVVSVGSAGVTRGELCALLRCFPGARCHFTYGLTELGPRVSTFAAGTLAAPADALAGDPARPAPIGAPLEGVSFEVRDAGADGVGQLFVRTPFASLGKLQNGLLEPLQMEGGFATRDAARVSHDAQVELLGRLDGTIVRGGSNVYPGNVERVADDVEGVAGSCLVGRRSALYGEVPVLVIEVAPSHLPDDVTRTLEARLSRELSPTDMPAEIRVVEALPRTALGKVQRAQVYAAVNDGVAT